MAQSPFFENQMAEGRYVHKTKIEQVLACLDTNEISGGRDDKDQFPWLQPEDNKMRRTTSTEDHQNLYQQQGISSFNLPYLHSEFASKYERWIEK